MDYMDWLYANGTISQKLDEDQVFDMNYVNLCKRGVVKYNQQKIAGIIRVKIQCTIKIFLKKGSRNTAVYPYISGVFLQDFSGLHPRNRFCGGVLMA